MCQCRLRNRNKDEAQTVMANKGCSLLQHSKTGSISDEIFHFYLAIWMDRDAALGSWKLVFGWGHCEL